MSPSLLSVRTLSLLVSGLVLVGGVIYGGYRYYELSKAFTDATSKIQTLTTSLSQANTDRVSLEDAYTQEKQKNDSFEGQIGQISSTVGTLTKLSETDPQLLQKYSKVFFLSENYVPAKLASIDTQYLFDPKKPEQFETDAYPFLKNMIDEGTVSGIDLRVISAYRSFGTQAALKSNYVITYGTGANKFSADQGYSEHQLGTTLDFTTAKLGANFDSFATTDAYTWLNANAYKYGFELSYPKGNTYYQFEPWHWRFVGIKLATMLHVEGKNFYDLDQRTIDAYLIALFDTQ
jgi:LAS superfamily LD-carboxypeptidase LdcB